MQMELEAYTGELPWIVIYYLCAVNHYPVRVLVWDTRFSMLDCHLVKGVWYIYDWGTGWLVLMWWEASTGFSCMSFTR